MPGRKKFYPVIPVVLLALLLTASRAWAAAIPPGFSVWPARQTDNPKKTWTVKFNLPLNKATVNSNNIYVTDDNNQRVSTLLATSDDGTAVSVSPAGSYQAGKEYRLFLTGGLTSTRGLTLSPQVVVPFTVSDPNAKIILFESNYSSFLTGITVVTSPDVYSVLVNQTEMHYRGNNTYNLGVPGLSQGASVTVKAYDGSGKLLESKTCRIN
ncbi:MAG: Ig-like domain-containing protein [Firmicutes bacterium]|nr:Ig-like domain-containing protein [Bacillota bacterium]